MRSIAVVVAAMIAALVEGVTPTSADAIAAVVVSLIIVVSLGPLIQGLFDTWKEIRTLRAPK
jgi:Co/Zn/Cd efflux system component